MIDILIKIKDVFTWVCDKINSRNKSELLTTQIHEILSNMCIQALPTEQYLYKEFEKNLNNHRDLTTIQSRDVVIQTMLHLGIFREDKNGVKSFIFFSDILEELNKEYSDNLYKSSLTDALFQDEGSRLVTSLKRSQHDEKQRQICTDKFMKEFDKFKDSFVVNYKKKISNYLNKNNNK